MEKSTLMSYEIVMNHYIFKRMHVLAIRILSGPLMLKTTILPHLIFMEDEVKSK